METNIRTYFGIEWIELKDESINDYIQFKCRNKICLNGNDVIVFQHLFEKEKVKHIVDKYLVIASYFVNRHDDILKEYTFKTTNENQH
jgi:hypothetical protein